MTNAFVYIIHALGRLFIFAFLLRFLLQWVRADFHNPLSQAIVKITNPLVIPLRKFIPSIRGIDTSTLLVILGLQMVLFSILALITSGTLPGILPLFLGSLIEIADQVLWFYFIIIFVSVILSWVNPGTYNPVTSILYSLTEPIMAPVRRLIPSVGGLDLSPIFVIIAIGALMQIVQSL